MGDDSDLSSATIHLSACMKSDGRASITCGPIHPNLVVDIGRLVGGHSVRL